MKKGFRRFAVIALTLVMALGIMTGCGPKKPTAEDAQAYVKAVLDLMCTGDYDHSVDLADVESGQETAIRDEVVKSMVDEVAASASLDPDVAEDFTNLMLEAFGKAKYTVGEATPTEDGFDVTVTMEPLKVFNVTESEFEEAVTAKVMEDAETVAAMNETEQTNYVMKILIDFMRKGLEDPQYDDPEDVVVHYGPIDDKGSYGCSKEDGEKLGAKLFSTEGL